MSPALRSAPTKRTTLSSGPWSGIVDASDPFENSDRYLYDATNLYVPDPARGSAAMARPGFYCMNPNAALGVAHQGQCVYEHVDLDGTIRRILILGGKVFRWDGNTTAPVFTDVTPVGPSIAVNVPVFCMSLSGKLVVTDGLNRPWVGTNLNATPITGVVIQYDTAADQWASFGRPDVVGAKTFFIADNLNSVRSRSTVLWGEEADPATGYFQSGFDDQWSIQQNSSDPIYALVGDNNGFTYFRATSIGRVDGTVDKAFRTSASHDSIATDIGSNAPSGIVTTPSGIWFTDLSGRVYRLPDGGAPVDIWKQLRRATSALTGSPLTNTFNASLACYYAPLDLVLMLLRPVATDYTSGSTLYAFNATSGAYLGTWSIGGGAVVHAMGVMRDQTGVPTLILLGGPSSGSTVVANAGFVWALRQIGDPSASTWVDLTDTGGTVVPSRSATPRIVHSAKSDARFDQVHVVTASAEAMRLSYVTPRTSSTIATSATPSASQDGSYRSSWGTQARGREARFTVTPVGTPTAQWGLHAMSAEAIPLGQSPGAP